MWPAHPKMSAVWPSTEESSLSRPSLDKFKMIKIIQSIFFNHSGTFSFTKQLLTHKYILKSPNIWT